MTDYETIRPRIVEAAKVIEDASLGGTPLMESEAWDIASHLADAGLLATREEWSAAYYGVTADGTRTLAPIGTEGSREHAEETRADCAKDDPGTRFYLARRGYTEWEAVE